MFLSLARVILQLGTQAVVNGATYFFATISTTLLCSGLPVAVFILQATSSMSVKLPQTTQWLCEETRWRRKNYFHTYYCVGGMRVMTKASTELERNCEKLRTNNDVVFGDINLSENRVRQIHKKAKPWKRGWPTIRYFNKETGYGGKPYSKD